MALFIVNVKFNIMCRYWLLQYQSWNIIEGITCPSLYLSFPTCVWRQWDLSSKDLIMKWYLKLWFNTVNSIFYCKIWWFLSCCCNILSDLQSKWLLTFLECTRGNKTSKWTWSDALEHKAAITEKNYTYRKNTLCLSCAWIHVDVSHK